MSLVNDMLNDLEQRRSKPSSASSAQLQWLTGRAEIKKSRWPIWISFIILAIALVAVALLYRPSDSLLQAQAILDGGTLKAASVTSNSTEGVTPSTLEPTADAKPKLELVSIQKINNETKLLLQLDRMPGYQVTNNIDSLIVRLNNVQAHLPRQVGDLLKPVSAINVRRSGNDLLVHIALTEPVQSRVSLKVQPLIQLEVFVSAISKSQASTTNLSVKAPAKNLAKPELSVQSSSMPNPAENTKRLVTKPATKKSSPLKTRLPPTLQQQDKRAVKEARNRLQLRQPQAAEQLLIALLSTYPDAPESNQLLLAMLLDQQRLDQAEQRLQLLANKKPLSLALVQLQARLFLLQAKPGKSVQLLRAQQPMMQINQEYYELLALSAQRDKQYGLSEKVYKALLNIDAGKGDWWAGLAIAEELQGQKADARQHYRQAVQANRTSDALRQYSRQRYQALAGMSNVGDIKKTVEN